MFEIKALYKILCLLMVLAFFQCSALSEANNSEKNSSSLRIPELMRISDNHLERNINFYKMGYWRNKVILKNPSGLSFINDEGILCPLEIDVPGVPKQFCFDERNNLGVLTLDGKTMRFFVENGSNWNEILLPMEFRYDSGRTSCAMRNHELFLVEDRTIFFKSKSAWQSYQLQFSNSTYPLKSPPCIHLKNKNLIMGFDYGENGGHLLLVNLDTKKITSLDSDLPVTNICESKDGTTWILASIHHLTYFHSKLFSLKNKTLKLEVHAQGNVNNSNKFDNSSNFGAQKIKDNLKKNCLSGLFLDCGARPVLFVHKIGLLRNENGTWKKICDAPEGVVFVQSACMDERQNIYLSLLMKGILKFQFSSKSYHKISSFSFPSLTFRDKLIVEN